LEKKEHWSLEILPKASLLDFKLKEFWQYRDLVLLFVRRELVPTYKQTILGPLWFVLQPLLTTLVYSIIFGLVARIPTDGLPQILFYMPGIILWNFFNTSFLKCSSTFISNTHIFGKVYFPRLVLPVSGLISSFVNFLIQLVLFLVIFLGYYFSGSKVHPGWVLALSPVFLLIIAMYSLGMGMMVSAFTTRYRDLTHFLAFGTQLLMYATPIIYPASIVPASFRWVTMANPLSPLFEAFRYAFLGNGMFMPERIAISAAGGVLVLLLGLILFNKAERTSIDTV
jgi:lipopolysaccharide transport system permease protein